MRFEEGDEAFYHVAVWERSRGGTGNSYRKGPTWKAGLMCLKNIKECTVAEGETASER